MANLLLFTVFIIATCGLVYELICSTIASYLLGDSVTQFSFVIGIYLFSMGIGSYFAKYLKKNIILSFVQIELLIGLIGGSSAALLFVSFEFVQNNFNILLYSLISIIGILVGAEIPLLMRILKDNFEFSDLISKVFAFDYIGALIASLLFPLFLIPHLGLIRSSFLFGVLNILVALLSIKLFESKLPQKLYKLALIFLFLLLIGFIYSERIMSFSENFHYSDKVIYSKSSAYQRIVLTNNGHDLKLFLNGNLQFSSLDEYRYHETLVHIGLSALSQSPENILVLGGGDGLAVREILKYKSIQKIVLVDLDSTITKLFSGQNFLKELNCDSLNSPKLKVIAEDAFIWLQKNTQKFDFIVIDFPDPSNYALGKLYSTKFYQILKNSLNPDGFMVIQSTSPYYAKKSFWCIVKTLNSVGLKTAPYHAYIPSFGEWGYIIAGFQEFKLAKKYPANLKFINSQTAATLFYFPDDMRLGLDNLQINKLNNQVLVNYFEQEWSKV